MAPQVPVAPETSNGSIEEAAADASVPAVDTASIVTDEDEGKGTTTRSQAAAAAAASAEPKEEQEEEPPAEEEKKDDKPPAPKKDYSNWPLKDIREPHPNDVMFGRGGRFIFCVFCVFCKHLTPCVEPGRKTVLSLQSVDCVRRLYSPAAD